MNEILTPWMNIEEWVKVSEWLYSKDLEQQCWATERLAIWKIRSYPKLLSEIDATEALARAKYFDVVTQNTNNYTEIQDVVKLYSIALIRFIKLIDELGKKKGIVSVNTAAKLLNIPRWIADLRHDVTHYIVPPVRILREGVEFALNWLKDHYWDQRLEVSDEETSEDTLAEREANAKNLIDNFYRLQYNNPLATRKIRYTLRAASSMIRRDIETFSKILVSYMLPNEESLREILKDEKPNFLKSASTILPKSVMLFWSPVLKLYDNREKFCVLLKCLLSFPKPTSDSFRHRLVAAWMRKFLKSKKINFKSKNHFPKWSWLLKKALVCENEYSPEFLPLMLENLDVPIPEDKKQDLMALLAIRLGKTYKPKSNSDKVSQTYSVLDLEKVRLRETKFIQGQPLHWQVCTDDIQWRDWPLGCLPGINSNCLQTYAEVEEENNPQHL
ncbi:uncharacterized protein LOC111624898 [Centruroides sculpturatus]|uniref:uncharacterized protein LOC111624898 n=1 Tax=Centruroides sculpturatus TaxID=218467 RepID=UPI000C6D5713|nr:uncharacterized protein LOC111624898 [Centruroides sculpturatus]